MTPFDGLRFNPLGSDPDETMNEISSPLTEGVTENGSPFDRTYDD